MGARFILWPVLGQHTKELVALLFCLTSDSDLLERKVVHIK